MFDDDTIDDERQRVEGVVVADPFNFHAWERLGHLWRRRGDLERTMDCYRMALHTGPPHMASLFINIAGVLDQLNFVEDALDVMHALLDRESIDTFEAEANFPLAYIMAAQLHLRMANFDQAQSLLEAALELQPAFQPAVEGLHQEVIFRRGTARGDVSTAGTADAASRKMSNTIANAIGKILGWVPGGSLLVVAFNDLSDSYPRGSLFLLKLLNALPCIIAGGLTWLMKNEGSLYAWVRLPVVDTSLLLPLWLPAILLFLLSSVCTEYNFVDCLALLLVGHLLTTLNDRKHVNGDNSSESCYRGDSSQQRQRRRRKLS
jgi:tetratricopeptide (TPR) repeat protein